MESRVIFKKLPECGVTTIIPVVILLFAALNTYETYAQVTPGNSVQKADSFFRSGSDHANENINDDLCSISAIRRYLAREVRYPESAVSDGHSGVIELYARMNNDGRVNEVLLLQPGRDYVEVGEIEVTGYAPPGITVNESSRHESLVAEGRRVILSLPRCDIQEIFGQTLKITFKFTLN